MIQILITTVLILTLQHNTIHILNILQQSAPWEQGYLVKLSTRRGKTE